MKKIKLITIILVLGFGFSYAQNRNINPLKTNLEQLTEQIKTAQDLLRSFPDKNAQELIRQAEKLRQEAIALAAKRDIQLASAKLKQGLTFINKAINILTLTPLTRIRDQVDELLRRAEYLIPGSGSREAEKLFKEAQSKMQLAKNAHNANDYRKSMEYYRIIRSLVQNSLRMVQGPQKSVKEKIEIEKTKFEELLAKTERIVSTCEDPRAIILFNNARKQYQNINQNLFNSDMQFTLNLYYNATRLLLRVIDLCEGNMIIQADQVTEELILLGNMLDTVRGKIGSEKRNKNTLIFNRANRLYLEAQNDIDMNKINAALRKIDLARGLLNRIWAGNGRTTLLDRTKKELNRLQEDINLAVNETNIRQSRREKSLIHAARTSAHDAERYLLNGRIRMALESILAGNRFLSLLETSTPASLSEIRRDKINAELNQLMGNIEIVTNEENLSDESRDLLEASQQMAKRAQKALQNNEHNLAMEYLKLGFNLLQKIEK